MGNRVRERRQQIGLTLRELHEATNISVGLLSGIETGKHVPNVNYAKSIARTLRSTVEELFPDGVPDEEPPSKEMTA